MNNISVIFHTGVDDAIQKLIDYVPVDEVPTMVAFIVHIQRTLTETLSFSPEVGTRFQGNVRMFVVELYTFLYEYHRDLKQVHVLDLKFPGQDWR